MASTKVPELLNAPASRAVAPSVCRAVVGLMCGLYAGAIKTNGMCKTLYV
jgi:hypothetical protein